MTSVGWFRCRRRTPEWPLYLFTALLTGVLTASALELWAVKLTVPLTYWGDALAVAAHFKTVLETGWYEYQPLLGAPFGQTYNDFPTADNLNFMAAWVLGRFTDNFAVAMNLYFILGFPAAALAAVWFFRRLGISRIVSSAMAVLFALSPYHFFRGEGHLWLASYYIVPLSAGLVMMVMRDESLWKKPAEGSPWYRTLTSGAAGTLLILLLSATAQSYYAIFFLILLAFAGVVRLVRTRDWRKFWGAATAGMITVVGIFLNMLPDIIYSLINGQNPAGLVRGQADSEVYALKLSQLLLPWVGHRIDALRNLRVAYDSTYPLPSESPALGVVAASGLVILLLAIAYVATTRLDRRGSHFSERGLLLTQLAALVFVCFVFATVGGLSTFISFVTTSLRGWNRIVIFMALFCLAAVGVLLDILIRRLQRGMNSAGAKAAIASGIALVVLVGGYIDQTPENPSSGYPSVVNAFRADEAWFREIDNAMPAGAKVLQLPYQPFPESTSETGVMSSDSLIPYLHTTDIRWSAGGIKGRPRADWPQQLERHSPGEIVELAAAAGFAGIHIDRESMKPPERAELESGIAEVVASQPLASASGRYVFYDIRAEMAALRSKYSIAELRAVETSVVNPLEVVESSPATATAGLTGQVATSSTRSSPTLVLINPTGSEKSAVLSMVLQTSWKADSSASVRLALPDGETPTVVLRNGTAEVSVPVRVKPGRSSVAFAVLGASSSQNLIVTTPRLEDQTIAAFLAD